MQDKIEIPLEMMEKQIDLERGMSALGADRYFRGIKTMSDSGRSTEALHIQRMINRYLEPMTTSLNEWLDEQDALSTRGARKSLYKLVGRRLNPEVLSSITLGILIDSVSRSDDNRIMDISIYMKIADRVEDAMRQDKYETSCEQENQWLIKKLNERGEQKYGIRREELIKDMSRYEIEWDEWSKSNKMQIGAQLIDICVSRGMPGMFEIEKEHLANSNKTPYFIKATKDAVEWIEDFREVTSLLSPAVGPCIVPPKPWTSPLSGGYYSDIIQNTYNLIKRNSSTKTKSVCKGHDLSKIYKSLNTLQDTSWVINNEILEIAEACYKGVIDVPKYPPFKVADRAMKPNLSSEVFMELSDREKEEYKVWLVKMEEYHKTRSSNASKTNLVNRILGEARKYCDYENLYFVYNVDYRGRIYPLASFLSPQGNDVAKAVLQFKEGKKLGTQKAADWLAIQGANTFGEDKISMDDRVKWTKQNSNMIVAAARDPYNVDFWTKADKPFQFLSFCLEWEQYMDQGLEFVSKIAIAMDGSCSGIQHYSALYKDEVGAKAVNLIDSEVPSDIYGEVSKIVEEKIRRHMIGGEKYGKECLRLGVINRDLTKRSVMTLPYGVTRGSSNGYVAKYIKERLVEANSKSIKHMKEITDYIGRLVWNSITEVVFTPIEGKKWLQDLSKVLSIENKPITWVTPVGMPVHQARYESRTGRVHILVNNSVRLASFSKETKKIDKKGQSNSIAPNYIHSMDSSHLMMTVNQADDEGMTSFAMIHDSFGVHAADSQRFSEIIRESFVEMYNGNLLEDFYNTIQEQSDEGIPDKIKVPEQGNLDINEVLTAKYFFA